MVFQATTHMFFLNIFGTSNVSCILRDRSTYGTDRQGTYNREGGRLGVVDPPLHQDGNHRPKATLNSLEPQYIFLLGANSED